MAYTQTQLDALRSAVAKGVKKVVYDGQEVQYATTAEMLQVISIIERSLSGNQTTRIVYGASNGLR